MRFKTALLIGRFQPFHKGHLYLMKKTATIADKIIIGIGSANIYDSNNPLDWKTREKIIKAVFYKEKMEDKLLKITPLNDFFNDEKWLSNVKNKAGQFEIIVGNNDWVNRIMKKGGYEVLTVPYYKRYLYEGEKIRKLLDKGGKWENRVPEYLVSFVKENLTLNYNNIVLGGTFDHFHKGHRAMINKAFTVGRKVTIGVATRELYKDKSFATSIEPLSLRKKFIRDFLKSKGWIKRAKIISFSHFKGPLDKKKNVDAIVVSRQTIANTIKINKLRKTNKLRPLEIIKVDDVLTDAGDLLSSEKIRQGLVNREGKVYVSLFKKILYLPKLLREDLRKPLGKVIRGELHNEKHVIKEIETLIKKQKPPVILAVGDIIASSMEKYGIIPDVKIIDFKSRRKNIPGKILLADKNNSSRLVNKAGTINPMAVGEINSAINQFLTLKQPQIVRILGEEDLLALPAILISPLNSLIFYGHWKLGVVAVRVDEKKKNKVVDILEKFD